LILNFWKTMTHDASNQWKRIYITLRYTIHTSQANQKNPNRRISALTWTKQQNRSLSLIFSGQDVTDLYISVNVSQVRHAMMQIYGGVIFYLQLYNVKRWHGCLDNVGYTASGVLCVCVSGWWHRHDLMSVDIDRVTWLCVTSRRCFNDVNP